MTVLKVANNGNKSQVPTFENWFDRLFDVPSTYELGSHVSRAKSTMPAVNVHEDDKSFFLEVAAPGFKKEDFKINFEKERLIISSERKEEQKQEGKVTRKEFSYQSFTRSFHVPEESVDVDQIKAKYEDGILNITLPKKEIVNQVKQITVG
jgi:HSP20 family protein